MDPPPVSTYLGHPADWESLGRRLLECKEVCGVDTEEIGCDPENDTAVDCSRLILWSVGIPDGRHRPRGYREADGFVLPPAALDEPLLREWLEGAEYTKVLHNARFDRHTFANAGVDLRGVVDTVDIYRVICPGRERWGLKFLVPDILGVEVYGAFNSLFSEAIIKESTKTKKAYVCVSHGDQDGYRKYCEVCDEEVVVVERTTVVRKELKTRRKVPLHEICGVPVLETNGRMEIRPNEHPLWTTLVDYAGADAVWAAQLWQARVHQTEGLRKARIPTWLEGASENRNVA